MYQYTITSMTTLHPAPAEQGPHAIECAVTQQGPETFIRLHLIHRAAQGYSDRLRAALEQAHVPPDQHAAVIASLQQQGLLHTTDAPLARTTEEGLLLEALSRDDLPPTAAREALELLLRHDLKPGYYMQRDPEGTLTTTVAYSRAAAAEDSSDPSEREEGTWRSAA